MGRQIKYLHRVWLKLPNLHRHGVLGLVALVVTLMLWPGDREGAEAAIYLPESDDEFEAAAVPEEELSDDGTAETESEESESKDGKTGESSGDPDNVLTYDIKSGDSLSDIFDRLDLGQTAMYQILAADQSLLALDVMRPGQKLTFTRNPETGKVDEMKLFIHPGNQVVYSRVDEETFEYEEKITDGEWPVRLITGEVQGSFYMSAKGAGLSDAEIAEINRLFDEKFDFARDMRAGDKFEILRSEQRIKGVATGQTRIEGIRIHLYYGTFTAYLFEDGNYYDDEGESLARAFRDNPLREEARISSSFNPSRKHPVTGRVSPHNGTDYAVWTGNTVVTTGDGVVSRVENHPYAGKYVEIEHGSRYTTRYMHLSKITVSHGERVERGERIGLSGATGRVTGPHLHYEFHVNNRPVNWQTADIPMAGSVPDSRMADFRERVEEVAYIMENAEPTRLAASN